MDIDIQTMLTARFIAAIRKTFNPCPLIGPNWFRFHADGKPVDFQFAGLRRLAKAACRKPSAVAHMILKNLDLQGLEASVRLTSKEDAINVRLKNSPALNGLSPEEVQRKLAAPPIPAEPAPQQHKLPKHGQHKGPRKSGPVSAKPHGQPPQPQAKQQSQEPKPAAPKPPKHKPLKPRSQQSAPGKSDNPPPKADPPAPNPPQSPGNA